MAHIDGNPSAAGTAAATERHRTRRRRQRQINFAAINAAALVRLPTLLRRWLPDGKVSFGDYVAKNPRRDDKRPGSFRIGISNGKWIDFATKDKGGDPVSLFAFLQGVGQAQAALDLARLVGVNPYVEARLCRR
jgi:hypothetical protein